MDDIIIDDVDFHQGVDLRLFIGGRGHLFEYLQVYPPNFNAIEHQWAQRPFISSTENCSIEDRSAHFSMKSGIGVGTTPFHLTKPRNEFSIVLSKTKISDEYYDHLPKLLEPLFSFRYCSKYSNEVIDGGED